VELLVGEVRGGGHLFAEGLARDSTPRKPDDDGERGPEDGRGDDDVGQGKAAMRRSHGAAKGAGHHGAVPLPVSSTSAVRETARAEADPASPTATRAAVLASGSRAIFHPGPAPCPASSSITMSGRGSFAAGFNVTRHLLADSCCPSAIAR